MNSKVTFQKHGIFSKLWLGLYGPVVEVSIEKVEWYNRQNIARDWNCKEIKDDQPVDAQDKNSISLNFM